MDEEQAVVIFDFDGTIADSLQASLAVFYEVTHRTPLPREDVSRLRGLTAVRLLHELNIPVWRALFLARKARLKFATHVDEIDLIPGMDVAIRTLAKRYKLFVLTSNNEANVRRFLRRFELEAYFAAVYGGAKPWRKEKVLRRLMRHEGIDAPAAWYVGDGAWDVRAAHAAGLKAVAVTWGFSNLHVLKKSAPEALVFTADELIRCFSNNGVNDHA